MNIVETMVFNKLKEYREQANRERFILPKNKDIKYFKETIKKIIYPNNFFKKDFYFIFIEIQFYKTQDL